MPTPAPLRIDFVSDIACPWCVVGLAGLQRALAQLDGTVSAEIHLQPFELEPAMPFEGQDADEHIRAKYGISAARAEANRKALRERAAGLGFDYNVGPGGRVWNTFDAHRLLHWAEVSGSGKALALKQALFRAYFTDNHNVADHAVLVAIAREVGLDPAEAQRVVAGSDYADDVRKLEAQYQQAGVHAVPATIVNRQYLISGGQPPEVFESALREIAAKATAAAA